MLNTRLHTTSKERPEEKAKIHSPPRNARGEVLITSRYNKSNHTRMIQIPHTSITADE
jgi:hypothetical protein